MSKRIQNGGEIRLTPSLVGKYENRKPIVIDEDGSRLDPTNLDHKILIYEREVEEWFLNPAAELLKANSFNNAFVVLMICMSYFEGVEQYRIGQSSNGRSKEFFRNSVNRMYPGEFQDNQIDWLYFDSRCGLFHNGMVRGGVVFSNHFRKSIEFKDDEIKINQRKLLKDIRDDFKKYIDELKSGDDSKFWLLRENFNRLFTVL